MEAVTMLTVACAWCGDDLGSKPGAWNKLIAFPVFRPVNEPPPPSHGMCDTCHAGKELKYLLEDLANMAVSHPKVCDGIYERALKAIEALVKREAA